MNWPEHICIRFKATANLGERKITPDVSIARRSKTALSHVEGNLEVESDAVISSEKGSVIVDGRVETAGSVVFDASLKAREVDGNGGDLDVRGDLTAQDSVRITDGSLHVSGSLSARDVDVDRHLEVARDVTVIELEVGSRAEVHGNLKARSVEAGGSLEVQESAEVEEIDVGGSVRIAKQVTCSSIDVGGSVVVGGGKVTDRIDVGGTFESTGPLEFNDLDVGGSVQLRGDSSGRQIDVGGVFKVFGNLKFEDVDVGGTIEIEGNGDGSDVEIGGVLRVGGSLNLTGRLEVGGKCRIDGSLTAERIEIGGWLEAFEVKAKDIEVGGSITTEKGVRGDSITIGDRGRAKGPLIGSTIRVGEKSDVEALYGGSITMEERSRAVEVHGVDLRIESGCRIQGEVLYSGFLDADEDVSFAVEPKKVASLPPVPT